MRLTQLHSASDVVVTLLGGWQYYNPIPRDAG